jgi:two-component system OmpR family sensor kinase
MIELFLFFIFYQYAKIENNHIRTNLFLEMKNYSLSFDDARFDIDIVPTGKKSVLYELFEDNETLYILVPFQDDKTDLLKIFYPKSEYMNLLTKVYHKLLIQFLLLSLIAMLISALAAFYTLKPIRNALTLLEDFIKDIIHDLNTPVTSILINLKMIEGKSEEIESISRSANTIAMLHQNLDSYLREIQGEKEKISVKVLIEEQVAFFSPLYDYLQWEVDIEDMYIMVDKNAFSRILYNLISNACKYNTNTGKISIKIKDNMLSISNDSYGIKNPHKVFERFYKESERGLGIGLHIVHKLCEALHIKKDIALNGTHVTVKLNLSQVTSK